MLTEDQIQTRNEMLRKQPEAVDAIAKMLKTEEIANAVEELEKHTKAAFEALRDFHQIPTAEDACDLSDTLLEAVEALRIYADEAGRLGRRRGRA